MSTRCHPFCPRNVTYYVHEMSATPFNNPRPKSTSWKSWIAILNTIGHPNVHLPSRPSHPSIYLPPWWWRTYSRMDIQRNRITEELRQSICASFSQHLRTDFGSKGTEYFLDKWTIISLLKGGSTVARWKKHFYMIIRVTCNKQESVPAWFGFDFFYMV